MAINTGGAVSTLLIDDHASCVSASALLAQQDCCATITAAVNGGLVHIVLARFITPLRSIVDDDAPRPCADRDLGGDGIALGVDDRHLIVGAVGGIEAGAVA